MIEKVQDNEKKSHITTQNELKSEKTTQDVQKKCLSLTEQWKNGELEEGAYYVKLESGKIDIYFMVYDDDDCDEIVEILAPVPSYEKWEKLNWYAGNGVEENQELKMENAKLKDKNIKLAEMVDILSSNNVGNLGYKIKNQRHEINNRLKEIDKLKKLLKECREVAEFTKTIVNKHKWFNEVITKIDKMLK